MPLYLMWLSWDEHGSKPRVQGGLGDELPSYRWSRFSAHYLFVTAFVRDALCTGCGPQGSLSRYEPTKSSFAPLYSLTTPRPPPSTWPCYDPPAAMTGSRESSVATDDLEPEDVERLAALAAKIAAKVERANARTSRELKGPGKAIGVEPVKSSGKRKAEEAFGAEATDAPRTRFIGSSIESVSGCVVRGTHDFTNSLTRDEAFEKTQYAGRPTKDPSQCDADLATFMNALCQFIDHDPTTIDAWALDYVKTQENSTECMIKSLKTAKLEHEMYQPFHAFVNPALTDFHEKYGGLHVQTMDTHNRRLRDIPCIRFPDVLMFLLEGAAKLVEDEGAPVRARDALLAGEMKLKSSESSNIPKLFVGSDSEPLPDSTYNKPPSKRAPELTAHQQLLDSLSQLLSVQGLTLSCVPGFAIIGLRFFVVLLDRAGCIRTPEVNFENQPDKLLSALVKLQLFIASEKVRFSKLKKAPLSYIKRGPLPKHYFQPGNMFASHGAVQTLAWNPGVFTVPAAAIETGRDRTYMCYGPNLSERPLPVPLVTLEAALAAEKPAPSPLPDSDSGSVLIRRQLPISMLFGADRQLFDAKGSGKGAFTVMLFNQHRGDVSEPEILRYLNECGVPGVPTLAASSIFHDFDEGTSREAVISAFSGLAGVHVRKTNMVRRVQVLQGRWKYVHSETNIINILSAYICYAKGIIQSDDAGVRIGFVNLFNLLVRRDDPSTGAILGWGSAILESSRLKAVGSTSAVSHQPRPVATKLFNRRVYDDPAHLPSHRLMDRQEIPTKAEALQSLVHAFHLHLMTNFSGHAIEDPAVEMLQSKDWKSIRAKKDTLVQDERQNGTYAKQFARGLGIDPNPLEKLTKGLMGMLQRRSTRDEDVISMFMQAQATYENLYAD
ncbi:hypothetical protein DL93DRAFT_2228327 [Clavulina sp. PMI_390]|nr:hypothetical protein DL93DRAFT_2228327 [Clavulina sp. PMI_390]